MHRLIAIAALSALLAGCNRNDAERLGRIGSKMSAHARSGSHELGAKLDLPLPRREPSLQEKVQDRLRYDKQLTDARIEVAVKEKEVELKGTVKDASQKQRAIELAETIAGVEKVSDAMTLHSNEPRP